MWSSTRASLDEGLSPGVGEMAKKGECRPDQHFQTPGCVLEPGLSVPAMANMLMDYHVGTCFHLSLDYSIQKLFISVNLENQISYTKFSK